MTVVLKFLLGAIFTALIAISPANRSGLFCVEQFVPQAGQTSFNGLKALLPHDSAEARVLMVHGMGGDYTILKGWRKFADKLAKRLVGTGTPTATRVVQLEPWKPEAPYGSVEIRTYANGGKTLTTYFVAWYPLLDCVKDPFIHEETAYAAGRVRANRALKRDLMNASLSDVVIYLGKLEKPIENAVQQSICLMLDGKLENGRCVDPATKAEVARGPDAGLGIITHSLGSFVTLQAINSLDDESRAKRLMQTRTASFFMLANQVPLLRLADMNIFGEDRSPFTRFLDERAATVRALRSSAHTAAAAVDLELVTISDTNDLLSYPIPKSVAERYELVSLVNVLTPLGWRLGASEIVEPTTAHTRHKEDERVLDLLVHGYKGKRQRCT